MTQMPPLSSAGRLRRALLPLLLLAAPLGACTVNPATGERQFTALLPPGQEQALGAQEHPRVLAEFGGAYDDPELQAYVDRLGQRLVRNTERPDVKYTFTVLDSDVVNAFALPGGYVYVSRGLMALANSEAQLAGVIGHEIAHITARHTAERYSQGTLAQVAAAAVGIFGGAEIGQLATAGSQLVVAGWSRGQELEADEVGIRYMADAGYAPEEMAEFLATMGRHGQLEALLAGRPGAADTFNYLQTHPPTGRRVAAATTLAGSRPPGGWEVGRDAYLRRLEGVIYGDNPENGLVRGRVFAHPKLGFRFQVPEGYRLLNGQRQVTAVGPQGGAAILIDTAPAQGVADPQRYIAQAWAPQAQLQTLEPLQVNGLPGATAVTTANTQAGPVTVRLVAIRWDANSYYRFSFISPAGPQAVSAGPLRAVIDSFRRLSPSEADGLQPYRIRVVTVQPGQTVADFVRAMPFDDFAEERFRVLNNLPPGTQLVPGQLVKVVRGN